MTHRADEQGDASNLPRGSRAAPARQRRGRRWPYVLFALALLLVGVPVAVWHGLTGTWFLGPRVGGILSGLTGSEVEIGEAQLDRQGRLHMRDVVLRAPGVNGAAGELVRVPFVRIDIDPRELLAGNLSIEHLVIGEATVRLSEDERTGRFNVGALRIDAGPSGDPIATLPGIELRNATLEIGRHDARGRFTRSGAIGVDGRLEHATAESPNQAANASAYVFDLVEIEPPPASAGALDHAPAETREPLRVNGRFDAATGQASALLSGVTFDDDRAALLPSVAREWWSTVAPAGRLEPVAVQIQPDGRYQVEVIMDGIDWSLPVPAFDPGASDLQPRMTDVRGTIVLRNDGVDLVGLSGVIDAVRYSVHGGFTSVDRSPGFNLTFEVHEFDLSRNLNVLTALPPSIRDLVNSQLVDLGGPTGTMSARVEISRDSLAEALAAAGSADETRAASGDGPPHRPVHVHGRVELSNAEGSYAGFPYRLTGVDGAVEFEDDEVRIVSLAGSGPGGGRIFISGRVAPLDADPQVEVDLYAVNVPLDDNLRRALGEKRWGAYDMFLDANAAEALHDAGVFMTPDDVDSLRAEIIDAMRVHRELSDRAAAEPLDADSQARLDGIERRMREYERRLERPVFQLGGRVNLRSSVQREAGPDRPVRVATSVTAASRDEPLGLIYSKFPYPVHMVDGELLIGYDRIEIARDLIVVGPSGGRALVAGYIDRVRTSVRRLEPHLRLTATGAPIDALLLHAIPGPVRDDPYASWPGRSLSAAAETLAGLRLEGAITADGEIYPRESDRKTEFDIRLELVDGATRLPATDNVAPGLPPWEASLPWRWPKAFPLTGVHGTATLHRRSLDLHRLAGEHEGQAVEVSGLVAWPKDEESRIELNVAGRALRIEPHLIDLAAAMGDEESLNELRRFWARFEPTGTTDLNVVYHRADEAHEEPRHELRLRPSQGELTLFGRRLRFDDVGGEIELQDGALRFAGTTAWTTDVAAGQPAGDLRVDGVYDWHPRGPIALTGTIASGRMEAPIWRSITTSQRDAATPDGAATSSRSIWALDPGGEFDATFSLHRESGEEALRHDIDLVPRALAFTWRGERFDMRGLSGSVSIAEGRSRFEHLRGRYQDGEFGIDGDVLSRPDRFETDLRLDVTADGLTPRVRSLLPRAGAEVVDAIDLDVDAPLRLSDAHVRYVESPDESTGRRGLSASRRTSAGVASSASSPLAFELLQFDGLLDVREASMKRPVAVSDFDGAIDFHVRRSRGGAWLESEVTLAVDAMRAMGRRLYDVDAQLRTGESRGEVVVEALTGYAYGGRVAGEGLIQIPVSGRPGRYAMAVTLADVAVDGVLHDSPVRRRDETDPAAASEGEAASRPGWAYGHLSIEGEIGRPASRRGRGHVRVIDARMYDVPLVMWLLQLSSLTVPASRSFDYGDVSFFIDGDDVVFERLRLDSPTIALNGQGVLNIETQAVDLELSASSNLRAPIITALWEGLRDALVSIRVTGTLEEPRATIRPFGGLREEKPRLRRSPPPLPDSETPGDAKDADAITPVRR